jgi:hypothetical protein
VHCPIEKQSIIQVIRAFAASLHEICECLAGTRVCEGKFRLLALLECEMTKTLDYIAMLAALAAIGAVCVGMR